MDKSFYKTASLIAASCRSAAVHGGFALSATLVAASDPSAFMA